MANANGGNMWEEVEKEEGGSWKAVESKGTYVVESSKDGGSHISHGGIIRKR